MSFNLSEWRGFEKMVRSPAALSRFSMSNGTIMKSLLRAGRDWPVARYSTALALCAIVLWSALGRPRTGQSVLAQAAPAQAADPLVTLNDSFREAYARYRQKLIEGSGPVLLVEGDTLVLIREGKRSEVPYLPPIYDTLKSVAHVPLAVYVLLMPLVGAPLDKESLERLNAYRDRVVLAEAYLKNTSARRLLSLRVSTE